MLKYLKVKLVSINYPIDLFRYHQTNNENFRAKKIKLPSAFSDKNHTLFVLLIDSYVIWHFIHFPFDC